MPLQRTRKSTGDDASAEDLAIEILTCLAADHHRLLAFVETTGTDPATLRTQLGEVSFRGGLFDYLLADEQLLLAIAKTVGRPPADLARAMGRLPTEWHD